LDLTRRRGDAEEVTEDDFSASLRLRVRAPVLLF
jgi:hypothetical protein